MNNLSSRQFYIAIWILFFGFFAGVNTMHAQSGTVSVDFKNASPKEIIDNLESRTPYRFIYQNDINLNSSRITLKKDNVSIDEILSDLQKMTGFNFKRNNNNIAINVKVSPVKKKTGKISGKLVDNLGMPLPGASIRVIEKDIFTSSDANGDYSFPVEIGTYTVEVGFMSFQTQKITGVQVKENETTPLNIALKEDAKSLDEVIITQTYQKATASTEGMLLQQKQAAQFSDGISAEQIARTPDKDVGATLKRITGVTTVDDRYVVVRSMGERWNQAVMDGVTLPSTDPAQQQFSFDIIPTAVVESVVVSKSATPDMNANFAGGYIEVKTKDIPKSNFTSFSVGTSYNSRSAFKDRLTREEGKYDYLGFDDSRRDYPEGMQPIGVPTTQAESGPFLEQSKRFTQDNFSTYKTYGAPGTSLQFGIGRSYELKDNNRWGFVASVIFRNTQEKLDIEHTERGNYMLNSKFDKGIDDGYSTLHQYGFRNYGGSYNFNSTLGGIFNGGIRLGNNKLSMRNTLMHIYDNTLTQITGWEYYGGNLEDIVSGEYLPYIRETNYPVFQTFMQSKIEGEHKLGDLQINWFAAYSGITKDTKDATFIDRSLEKVGDDILQYILIYNSTYHVKRANFTNDEKNYTANVNFKYAFDFGESFRNEVKFGYFGTYKKATNQQQSANMVVVGHEGTDRATVTVPVSQLLDGSYYRWGGFGWEKLGSYGDKYIGDVKIHTPYLMLDNKIGRFVRLVWGLRAESYVYTEIASQKEDQSGFNKAQRDDDEWQYMPSANLTVSVTNKTNLRFGYSKSVLRPQFSERIGLPYYDPLRSASVYNNPYGIISTTSDNYDLKAEWFPAGGEIVSFGVYHKNIKDPIESITQIGNDGGSRLIYNTNSYDAKLFGIEMEIYKNLSFLGDDETLKEIYFYGNAAFNKTKVTGYVNTDGTGGTYKADRPLYGQSPYNYNLGLDYIGQRLGFSVRYNAIGDQYTLVGYDYNAEEIRKPYGVTDAQIGYKLGKNRNIELKCSMKNLFDTPIETYSNTNSYSKNLVNGTKVTNPREQLGLIPGATNRFDEGIDSTKFKAWNGRTISLTMTYNF